MLLPDITTGIVNDFHNILHTVGHFGTYLAELNPGQTLNDDPSGSDWFPAQLKNSIRALLLLYFNPVYYIAALAAKLTLLASRITMGKIVESGWYNTMSYVNILAIMFLMALALANALKINLDTYQIKKTLPALIVGFLLANFSLLGCRAVLDFNDILVTQIHSQAGCDLKKGCTLAGSILEMMTGVALPTEAPGKEDASKNIISVIESMGDSKDKTFVKLGLVDGAKQLRDDVKTMTPTAFVSGIMLAIMTYLPIIVVFLLALILLGRQIIIYIIVILAPLGFLCFFFPPTKEIGKKWLNAFIQWAFLPAIVFFILSLAAWFGTNGKDAIDDFTGSALTGNMLGDLGNMKVFAEGVIIYISGLFLLVAALLFPMQVSGLGGLITQLGMAYMYRSMNGGGAMGATGQAGNLLGTGTDAAAATQSAAGKGMPGGINLANMTPTQKASYEASQSPINQMLSGNKFRNFSQQMGGIVNAMEKGNIKTSATPELNTPKDNLKNKYDKTGKLAEKANTASSPYDKNSLFNKNLNALKQAINTGDSKQAENLSKQLLETADAKQLMQLSDYYNTLTPQQSGDISLAQAQANDTIDINGQQISMNSLPDGSVVDQSGTISSFQFDPKSGSVLSNTESVKGIKGVYANNISSDKTGNLQGYEQMGNIKINYSNQEAKNIPLPESKPGQEIGKNGFSGLNKNQQQSMADKGIKANTVVHNQSAQGQAIINSLMENASTPQEAKYIEKLSKQHSELHFGTNDQGQLIIREAALDQQVRPNIENAYKEVYAHNDTAYQTAKQEIRMKNPNYDTDFTNYKKEYIQSHPEFKNTEFTPKQLNDVEISYISSQKTDIEMANKFKVQQDNSSPTAKQLVQAVTIPSGNKSFTTKDIPTNTSA